MISWLSAVGSTLPSVTIPLAIATLVMLVAIAVHNWMPRSAAARHAVMLVTLVTIGLCPVMLVATHVAGVRAPG